MEAAVSSSLGAMGPLLRKLDLLLAPEYRLRKPLRDGVELLKEDLQEISSALVELSTLETPTLRAKCWMQEARELSYLIDDFVDDMMRTRSDAGSKMRSVYRHRVGRVKIAQLPEPPRRGTRISRIIQLRALLRQASERHERYQLDACCSSSGHMITRYGRAPTLYGDAANLFGIEDSRIKLVEMLNVEAEQRLKVISIVGLAGVGKTTLAKEIFHELGGQFELQAFVRASRKLDMRRLLGSILSQVWPHHQLPSVSVQNLIDSIQEQLQDKRCFIVIDDLWEETAWDIVSVAFPESNNCSRIVATTENMNVALKCCGYMPDNILKMKSLGIQDSGNLFFNRIFRSEQQCPDELKEVSYGIVRKCGGLPLALINLAGLLASQLEYSELWYHVHDRLCSILDRSHTIEEIQKQILNLSYNSLPHCLKTCLLYFNMYPEGYIMLKVHLVKQWIAEGFINATEGKDTEEIAESYFDELVNRGMIQPMKLGYNNEVLSCTVHHIILDLISHNSKEEEFLAAIDYSQTITGLAMKAHRLSFRFSSAKYAKQPAGITMPQLRSLGFFGVHKCMPPIVEFKHLRVLILDVWGDHDVHMSLNLSGICRLFQLRYLKISSDIMIELPAQMQGLHYLETLEIDARISAVPLDIVHLPRLLHLGLRDAIKLPDEIGHIKSLSTLLYFDLRHNSEHNIWSLGKLTNLQHLHLTCSAAFSGDQLKRKLVPLVSSLGKFGNLKSLILTPDALRTAIFFDISSGISSPPILLQRLELLPPICFISRLPTWIAELHQLRILKIVVKELQGNDISNIAVLPSLVVLSLYVRTAPTGTIIFSNMAFPALKYFKFTCSVMCLAFQAGAIPNLQRLKLCFNAHRRESHNRVLDGIEHLLNLQEVAGQIGDPPGAGVSDRIFAKLSFEDTIIKHPRRPRLNIQFVDSIEEEYLPLDKPRREEEGSSCEYEIIEKDCTKDTNKHADSRDIIDDPRKRPVIRDIIDTLGEMETSEGSATSGISSVIKGLSMPLTSVTPSLTSGKDKLKRHQQTKTSIEKKIVIRMDEKSDKHLTFRRMDEKSGKPLTLSKKDKHLSKALEDLEAAAATEGVSSVTIQGHDMVVVGSCDPVKVYTSVRKVCNAHLVSVGPANLKEVVELEAPGKERTLAGEQIAPHPPYGYSGLDAADAFQRCAADLLTDLLVEGSGLPDLLSLDWTRRLLDAFLLCIEEFRALFFGPGAAVAASRPPLDRLVNDFFDHAVKALDICNAVRVGLDLVRKCHKYLAFAAAVLVASPGPATPLGKAQIRRARKALTNLTILMLDDRDGGGNRSFGRGNKDARPDEHGEGHHCQSSGSGHLRSLSSSVSRAWSAVRQLQVIGGGLPVPRPHDITATGGLASAVYTMGTMLFIVAFALVAAIPCQDRGLDVHFSVPRNFPWSGPAMTLYERIVEESKKERKNSCGLLKEIHQIELCSRHLMDITDTTEFPLPEEKDADVQEAMQEVVQVCQSLKNGLNPLEGQVSKMFHGIVCTRTAILDRLSGPHAGMDLRNKTSRGFFSSSSASSLDSMLPYAGTYLQKETGRGFFAPSSAYNLDSMLSATGGKAQPPSAPQLSFWPAWQD